MSTFNECKNGVVQCAQNASCFDLALGYYCQCNDGFEGDGYKSCDPKPFEHLTVTLVVVIVMFFVLLAILVYFLLRQKLEEESIPDNPYDIKWNKVLGAMREASLRKYENVIIPVQERKISLDSVDLTKRCDTYVTADEIVAQKQRLKSCDDDSPHRVIVHDDDDSNDGVSNDEGKQNDFVVDGIDNPAFEERAIDIPIKDVQLTSFKPPAYTAPKNEDQNAIEMTSLTPQRAYSSRDSFKQIEKSPKVSPKTYYPSEKRSYESNVA